MSGSRPTPTAMSWAVPKMHSTGAHKSRALTEPFSQSCESIASNPCDAATRATTSSTSQSCTQLPRADPSGSRGADARFGHRFLHIFDFSDGLISRESAWIDLGAIPATALRLSAFTDYRVGTGSRARSRWSPGRPCVSGGTCWLKSPVCSHGTASPAHRLLVHSKHQLNEARWLRLECGCHKSVSQVVTLSTRHPSLQPLSCTCSNEACKPASRSAHSKEGHGAKRRV